MFFLCTIKKPTDKPVPNATLQVTGAVGWRREGLVYKKNEVALFSLPLPISFAADIAFHLDYNVCSSTGVSGYCRKR